MFRSRYRKVWENFFCSRCTKKNFIKNCDIKPSRYTIRDVGNNVSFFFKNRNRTRFETKFWTPFYRIRPFNARIFCRTENPCLLKMCRCLTRFKRLSLRAVQLMYYTCRSLKHPARWEGNARVGIWTKEKEKERRSIWREGRKLSPV